MGGCRNSTATGCTVCRNYRNLNDFACVRQCADDRFIYSNLCVDANFCIRKRRKPFLGECRESCPPNYIDRNQTTNDVLPPTKPCMPCTDQCARECPATEVDSLATSDLLRGCQIIKGDIYIRLQSGVVDTMKILERNLGDIEEIEGMLKVKKY